ncbi:MULTISPECIES: LysR family transcriptional regulator [Pseudonocardia]|uniref:HTH-type transcriptional regulator GltC n=2 Tax=Pseudonocardia TaxID=1847 RepID=A0A1Y2MPP3_PSEAH|nr:MULTISPECIES: LysR family transcriptional regulator [Pseudonocardia]OSY37200.1 HTH-type transcriptional regulator GltC [Pseudonocardia autotrophica]TDN74821.1 DNA-binding transcriptional LysR family regulator [Pseudonocardia autotrophica]BBG05596.1 LysR family transcriptional regulator [Pseudonocardia autotrophica]GEC25847.1 LysR family transcriptional regulator [Pseudonocardia saturnea]
MLDAHRLRVFRSVVASGSVQAAAANLGYTPSAVSQHITALQRETGLVLFERAGRGLRVTAAGTVLAAQADAILARLGEAEIVVADLRAGRTGTLSVSYFASVGAAWMPGVVRRLTTDFPGVRLDLALREYLPDDPAQRSDVQVAVERSEFAAWPGFGVVHLLDDPYVVVLPDTHPLADRAEIELAELAGERWVDNDVARGWCRRNLIEACSAAGFRPPFHVEAHDYPTAMAFVGAGIGVTVLPRLGAARLPPGTRAVPVVRPEPVRSILAVVRDAVADTPPVVAALAELRAVAGCSALGALGALGAPGVPEVLGALSPAAAPSAR